MRDAQEEKWAAVEKFQAARDQYHAARDQIAVAIQEQYWMQKEELINDKISMPQYLYCLGAKELTNTPIPSPELVKKYSGAGRNALVIQVLKKFGCTIPQTRPLDTGQITRNFLKSLKDAKSSIPEAKSSIPAKKKTDGLDAFIQRNGSSPHTMEKSQIVMKNEWITTRRTPAIVMKNAWITTRRMDATGT
jgi:hypothetical protein